MRTEFHAIDVINIHLVNKRFREIFMIELLNQGQSFCIVCVSQIYLSVFFCPFSALASFIKSTEIVISCEQLPGFRRKEIDKFCF